ncbi:stage II sporulation protein R [Biomaibacter acetigenes]|uniref:Stage II sporulation protein R n=1 Tax=Biomaibacter acetigenes TaxID=2316383 RepID=A0A3G2R9C9_9FIRM|nr:stage II sporulation protein R [Biomaibacter acetigenes]AYO32005.1 stage II sporulation protein R [Biomaibacter acetigenes]RKL63794.1 stage II sporulation protein R [Thermoanaerobacteraceae bacterium SP2]
MGRKLALLKKITLVTAGILALTLLAAIFSSARIAGGPVLEEATPGSFGKVTAEELSSKLIRLHIIANSDSPEDQALKLRVRDDIINALDKQFEGIDDIDISREFIKSHLKDIEEIALRQIKQSGKDYTVKAFFGRFPFPVKNYGYVTLPAGEYEALRVVIGKGEGANWWCVLFPPLCFVDITHGLTREEARERMGEVLTPREMAAIETASSPEEVPVEVRFKILEWWKAAKGRINSTIKIAFR